MRPSARCAPRPAPARSADGASRIEQRRRNDTSSDAADRRGRGSDPGDQRSRRGQCARRAAATVGERPRRRRSGRAGDGAHGAGWRRATTARARVGQGGRTADPVHPRLVAEPSLLGEAVREQARRRVPARRLRPPWSWHVRGAARTRALHRRPALGRRCRGDHRPTGSRPAGARRVVLRPIRHLRLRARLRPGSNLCDQLRRGCGQARPGGLRHADRPRIPRQLRRHGR